MVIWQRGKLSLLGRIKTATVKSLENTVGFDREIPEKSTWIGLEINAEQRASDVLTAACLMSWMGKKASPGTSPGLAGGAAK